MKFKPLSSCDVLKTLLEPSTLRVLDKCSLQENTFQFSLTRDQFLKVFSSWVFSNAARNHRIQLRIGLCDINRKDYLEDRFPPMLDIQVNNKTASTDQRATTALDITDSCMKVSSFKPDPFSIRVVCCPESHHQYVVGVYLVSYPCLVPISRLVIISRLAEKFQRNLHVTLNMIKEKLDSNPDESMVVDSPLFVSLNCPIDKSRMVVPVRAKSCNHLQCFDGANFIEMNKTNSPWWCPICDKPADLDLLYVDDYFTKVCSEAPEDCTEVELHDDGTWTPVGKHETLGNDCSKNSSIEVIDLTMSINSDIRVLHKKGHREIEIIDLDQSLDTEFQQKLDIFGVQTE